VFNLLAHHSADGSLHFLCMDWRHAYQLLQAADQAYSALKNLCVWVKTNGLDRENTTSMFTATA
jgi:hypothetical protein